MATQNLLNPLGLAIPPSRFTNRSAITFVDRDPQVDGARLGITDETGTENLALTGPEVAELSEQLRHQRQDPDQPSPVSGWRIDRRMHSYGSLVIAEIDRSTTGNTILRIGKLLGEGWEQVHYVVLVPDEREQLIELLSR